MTLFLITTPIGNLDDISLRAIKTLQETDHIICEELKTCRRRLSAWGISPREKKLFQLNEHTTKAEIEDLVEICKKNNVSLITDCGTPSFFDPGFKLVEAVEGHNDIKVVSLPGVSSMNALFPYLKKKTERFEVWGFPPRATEERASFFKSLKTSKNPVLILDTPYRLQKTFEDLNSHCPQSDCVAGINLTCENERILYGKASSILLSIKDLKKENFVCMVYPGT